MYKRQVVRHKVRFGATYETILLVPLIFPHAAIGVIMIVTLSGLGWLGTFSGLILVHCILTIPYAFAPSPPPCANPTPHWKRPPPAWVPAPGAPSGW